MKKKGMGWRVQKENYAYLPSFVTSIPTFLPVFSSFLPCFPPFLPSCPAYKTGFSAPILVQVPQAQITPLCPQIGYLSSQISNWSLLLMPRPLGIQIRIQVFKTQYLSRWESWVNATLIILSPTDTYLGALDTAGRVTLLRLLIWRIIVDFQEGKGW